MDEHLDSSESDPYSFLDFPDDIGWSYYAFTDKEMRYFGGVPLFLFWTSSS
jgi:hypothetical protein